MIGSPRKENWLLLGARQECRPKFEKSREKSFKGLWWGDPTSTLGDPDGMMWRLLSPGGTYDYWRDPKFDELGNAARFTVDEKFRAEAYRDMTKIFLENFPWLPVIQPYEDYGMQKYSTSRPIRTSSSSSGTSTSSSAAPRHHAPPTAQPRLRPLPFSIVLGSRDVTDGFHVP